ncbi:ABC transporter permease [Blastococcus sp. Marseille-P5729]|uniref:ABC transporter permease n=1 Tax=Blastococcus sp. Marseille-P5729 TaxID=2086582 RepID=UPI000D108676|nr:ABC transporter permease [Blastococcus sp. Marseille-P5729]
MSAPSTTRSTAGPAGPGQVRRRPSNISLTAQVARREISTKLRDRAYLISMAVFVLIIVAVIGFNVLANRGGDDYQVAVVGGVSQEFEQIAQANAEQAGVAVEFVEVADRAAGEELLADDADAVLDGDTLIRDGSLPTALNGILQGAHQSTVMIEQAQAAGIDPAQLAEVMQVEPLEEQSLSASSGDELQRGIIAMVAVGLAYGMLMMIIQFVAQGVVEEKSSRVVELLMTTVRPRQLLAGKVLGLGLLGFGQLLFVVGIGVVAAIAGDLVDIPASGWSTILQVLAWFVLGYAFFATLAAAAASLVSRQEDLGSALMPLTFVPMIAFFLAFRVLSTPDDALSTVLSMIPGISPTTMPVRAAMTSVPMWQYAIAILLQVIAVYLLVRVAARIYSGALLRTSGKLKVREALARDEDGSAI